MTNNEGDQEPRQRFVVGGANHGFVVSGGNIQVNNFGDAHEREHSLASERQSLFFEFFRQALKQAETTFRLSVVFMSVGAAIVLAGGLLAIVNFNSPQLEFLPLVSGLTGTLITVGGGALAVHANRARRHLTEQANKLDLRVEEDMQMERARSLIRQVADPDLRDRLNAITALRALNMEPAPEIATNTVLPASLPGCEGAEPE